MNTDRIAYFLAVVREGSLQAEQQRCQLLHDENPLSFFECLRAGKTLWLLSVEKAQANSAMNWEIVLFFPAIFPYPWKNAPLYASNPLKSP